MVRVLWMSAKKSVRDIGKTRGNHFETKVAARGCVAEENYFFSPFKQIWSHIQTAVAMSTSLIEYLSCGNCRSVSTIWDRCKEVGPRNQVHKWLISSDKSFIAVSFSCTAVFVTESAKYDLIRIFNRTPLFP